MKPNVPAEFLAMGIFGSADDDEVTADVPDPFAKLLRDGELAASLGGGASSHRHAHNLQVEAQERDAALSNHYRQIAEAAAKKGPAAPAAADPARLEKRFDEKARILAGYRQFFKERLAKGKTADEILNGYIAEFPHANPDVITLMREVASEFGA